MYSSLRQFLHPTFENKVVSSNETIASQTRCPNTLNVAEYSAFQDLRLGNRIPWIKLLREMASSNLNFGSIEVVALVTELALMAGPAEVRHLLKVLALEYTSGPALNKCPIRVPLELVHRGARIVFSF